MWDITREQEVTESDSRSEPPLGIGRAAPDFDKPAFAKPGLGAIKR